MLAVYIVNFASIGLWLRLILFVCACVVTFMFLRTRHATTGAFFCVLAGLIAGTARGIVHAVMSDTGVLGQLSRETTGISLPDWLFAVVAYFDAGFGILHALLGLLGMTIILELAVVARGCLERGKSQTKLP